MGITSNLCIDRYQRDKADDVGKTLYTLTSFLWEMRWKWRDRWILVNMNGCVWSALIRKQEGY